MGQGELLLTTRTPVGDKSYVKSRLYYDKFDNWLDYYSDITYATLRRHYKMGERSYYDDYTLGGSLEVGTTLVPNHNIKAAFHYKRDSHTEEQRVFAVGSQDGLHLPQAQNDNATTSIGLEDTYNVTKKFYIVAGLSYDTLKGLRANKYSFASSSDAMIVRHDYETSTKSTLNPQLGLFYSLTDTAKLHLTGERKTRFPTMKERYSWGNPTATTATIENPGLKPEEAINYEFGYDDVFFKRLRVKAAVFHNDIDDAIQSVTFTEGSVEYTQNQNIEKVKQYGAELQAIASITKDLEAGVNYMYLNRWNDSSDPTIAAYRLTDVPKNKVFTYAKYTATPLLRGLSFLGSLEYNSARYSSSTRSEYGYMTSAFTLVNLNGAYIIMKGLTVRAGVNNLFDENYEYTVGYPNPGRRYFANLTYSF
jgi:iron complex outermembrane receptor protein